jgi:ankyrin repeat protein
MRDALERLGSAGRIWAQDAEDGTGPDTRLLAYATSNWPLHYQNSNFSVDGFTASDSTEPDDLVAFLAEDTLREPWACAYRALAPGRSENTASETFSSLRVCAWLDLDHLLRRFGSGAGRQAWQQAAIEAAANGRIETLRYIFAIAPAGCADLNPDKAIRAAMSSRKEEVILEILSNLTPATGSSPSWVPDLLLQSSRLGFTSVVRKLLGPPWDASYKTAETLQPLHYAARGDHLEIAKLLHEAGADLAGTLDDGSKLPMSPLIVACDNASPQVAKFLLECGARTDITAGGERAWTPLQFAAAGGCQLAVESILKRDGRDSLDRYEPDAEHPAALAAVRGYWRCVEALCHPAGDFEMVVNGKTLLSHAVANGDVDMARMLLGKGAQLGGRHAEAQATLLHEAVKQNNDQILALLVDNGADVNAKGDSDGDTPLCLAAGRGLTDMVKWLLDQNAEIDKHGAEGKTPLYWATYNRHAKTLELLLQRGADVEGTTTDDGLWPIHVAYDSAEATRALLRRGAKCNRTSPWGTALFLAARLNFLATVQVLLDNDLDGRGESCNVDAAEDNGETSLSAALDKRNEDVVLALLDAGADVNRTVVDADADKPLNASLLHRAVARGSEALVAKMLQCRANVDARDAAGNTPLNCIQHDTPVSIARMLLCAGADVESANDGGYTPVWTALQVGNAAVTKLLLGPRGRAKVNLVSGGRDNDSVAGQSSLLQWACIYSPRDLVEAVVRLGAANVNIDIPGLFGTPLQAVCFRLTDPSIRPSSPPTAAAAAEDDIMTLSAEIIGLMRLLLDKGAELYPPRPSKVYSAMP